MILILSLPLANVIKNLDNPRNKQLLSSVAGAFIVTTVCGYAGLHSLLTAIINCAIVSRVSPRFCHVLSFAWCFGYLAFFRTTRHFGLPQVPPHANAVQLILTLKMVGLAFEVHDSWENVCQLETCDRKNVEILRRRNGCQNVEPTFAEMIAYSFCFVGLLTGPYYKYRTYQDMVRNVHARDIDTVPVIVNRLKYMPLIVTGFLIVSNYFSIQYVKSDEFYEDFSLSYRIFYMVPMFFIFRTRLYIAWLLAESVCIASTLGAYPEETRPKCGQGPTVYDAVEACSESDKSSTTIKFDFETIRNIDVYGCEFAPTVRAGMRSWNMTVQYWLATYVYRRVPFKSGPLRVSITMIVSAFWHGVHPGYYLSFLTIPFNLIAEDAMISAFRRDASVNRQKVFDWFCWFFKMRTFDYMCMGFLLLSLNDTLRYWQSVYFIYHVVIVVFIVVGYVVQMSRKKASVGLTSKKGD